MSVPTTTVRCTIHYPDGSAAAGVTVRASLTHDEVDGGLVVPRRTTGTTDSDGVVDLALWPNTRGVNGSQYRVSAVDGDGRSTLFDGLATVPESGSVVNLHSILTDPPPTVDAATQAVEDAQAARDKAKRWADEDVDVVVEDGAYSAKHHATKSAASASTASSAAGAASTSADAAAGSASAASDSAGAAAASAGTASSAASTAVAAQGAAATSAGAAADSASAASDSADDALAAAEASGDILFFATKDAADDALSGLDEGQIVDVLRDETRGGSHTRYQVVSAALVFRLLIDGASLYGPGEEVQDVRPLEGALRLRAMYDAERIRRLAGCPVGVHVGVRAGKTPGLADEEALVTQAQVTLSDEAAVIALAASGTGTWDDPYVIENLDISNPSGSAFYGIIWNDSGATYHIRLFNCRVRGWRTVQILIGGVGAGSMELLNCDIDASFNASYTDHCVYNNGDGTRLIVRETLMTTGPTEGRVFTNLGNNCRNDHIDSKFVGTGQIMGSRPTDATGGATVRWLNVLFCDFTEVDQESSSSAPIRLDSFGLVFEIERCVFPTVTNQIQNAILNFAPTPDLRWELPPPTGVIRYIKVGVVARNAIRLAYGKNVLIEYSDFLGTSSANHRIVDIGDLDVTDYEKMFRGITTRRCFLTRNTGSGVTPAEFLLYRSTVDGKMLENWSVWTGGASGEDCYEIYNPQGDSEIAHCVGDNIRGEMVDLYQEGGKPVDFAENGYVHHIYGTCHREVVSVTGINSGLVHDIYATSDFASGSVSGVPINDRSQVFLWSRFAGAATKNFHAIGPLPLPPASGKVFGTFAADGAEEIGDDVTAVYIEGDELVTVGDVDESRLVVK